jgi:hypothetical protein
VLDGAPIDLRLELLTGEADLDLYRLATARRAVDSSRINGQSDLVSCDHAGRVHGRDG